MQHQTSKGRTSPASRRRRVDQRQGHWPTQLWLPPSLPAQKIKSARKDKRTHAVREEAACGLIIHVMQQFFKHTRTPFPSSGFGYLTVGNSGSGSFCSSTAYGGCRSKALKAAWTNLWPTPCTDVCTIFTSDLLFMSLQIKATITWEGVRLESMCFEGRYLIDWLIDF